MNDRFPLKILLPIIVLALGLASYSFLLSSQPEPKKLQIKEKVWRVDTIKANITDLSADLELYATIESPDVHSAAAPAEGIVAETLVKVGQAVSEGQTLLALEALDFLYAVEQAEADVLDVEAQLSQLNLQHETNKKLLRVDQQLLTLTQSELDRVLRLQQKGLGSESVLTNSKVEYGKQQSLLFSKQSEVNVYSAKKQQLEAQLKRVKSRLQQAKLAFERSTIKAPFNGIVTAVNVSNGDRVKLADQLVSLYPQDQLEAKTRVPSQYQYEIQQLLASGEPVVASAQVAGHNVLLTLDRLSGTAGANGIEVYFSVNQGFQWLRLGNFLKLTVKRAPQKNVVQLPLSALYGTSRIYLKQQGRLQGIDVEVVGHVKGPNGTPFILVRSHSIQPTSDIVITHLPNAVNGLKVESDTGPQNR